MQLLEKGRAVVEAIEQCLRTGDEARENLSEVKHALLSFEEYVKEMMTIIEDSSNRTIDALNQAAKALRRELHANSSRLQ